MAGFRVTRFSDGYGQNVAKTTDPTDGMPDRWRAAEERLKELVAPERRGTFRVVVEWDVPPRREYDLLNHDTGIIVGKTFRYEGTVLYDSDDCYGSQFMVGVGGIDGKWSSMGRRVECWEVKQTLNKRAVLVPLDAVELIGE
jgi:hypothetical protein